MSVSCRHDHMRTLLAILLAPLAVPCTFAVTILLTDAQAWGPAAVVGGFSLAIGYVITVLVGVPLYFAFRHRVPPGRPDFLIGAGVGFIAAALYVVFVNQSMPGAKIIWFAASCVLAGAFTARSFRAIASGSPAAN